MNATTEAMIQPAGETGFSEGFAARKAELEAASMAELVTLGRLFFAAVNCRHSPGEPYDEELSSQQDDEMNVLITFDDELTELISQRTPKDATEYGIKAAYLFGRLRRDDVADAVEALALDALERDARAMAGLAPLSNAI